LEDLIETIVCFTIVLVAVLLLLIIDVNLGVHKPASNITTIVKIIGEMNG